LGKAFRVLDTHIISPYGGRIGFQGMQNHTAESIKSLEGYRVAFLEEANNFSQRSLDLLRPTIRWEDKARGLTSEIWSVWNPNLPSDAIDAFFRGNDREDGDPVFVPRDDAIVVEASYADNPWFPNVLRAEMEEDRRRDPDKYAHIWLGKYWTRSDARVFKNWKIEAFTLPDTAVYRCGADWGFSVDPSVLVKCALVENTMYVEYEAYQVGCEIVDTPDLFFTVPDAELWPCVADSARPETINHMQKNGFPKMYATTKGANSVKDGIIFLQGLDIVVHPRCKHVADELSSFSYKIDRYTDKVLPILEDKKNHTIDALRYACEGVRKAKGSGKVRTVTEVLGMGAGRVGFYG
jgi:phage terminase large subunit